MSLAIETRLETSSLLSEKLPKKSICKWSKETLQSRLPLLAEQAESASLVCKKCGRIAADKALLCKPVTFEKILESRS